MSGDVIEESDGDGVDEILAKEMLKMSVNDRNAIHEEMHGVKSLAVPETPELLATALAKFQRRIDEIRGSSISSSKMKVYNMILKRRTEEIERNRELRKTTSPASASSKGDESTVATQSFSKNHYAIDDDDFRLRFLRVELFNVPLAVDRFLGYLELTHEFWGDVILERPVYMSDLMMNKKERNYLKKGYHQVLPFRDRSGRKVVVDLGPFYKCNAQFLTTMFKVLFYINDAATRDCVETQRMGMVSCFETHDWEMELMTLDQLKLFCRVMSSIPVRYVAMHMCVPEHPLSRYFRNTIFNWLGGLSTQLRMITTEGTAMECRYKLKSYGIPTELYPLTLTGNFKLNCHQLWMKTRLLLEEKDENRKNKRQDSNEEEFEKEDIVECPCKHDVTFRRGTSSLINPGNVSFRALMLNYFQEKKRREEESEGISNVGRRISPQSEASGLMTTISHEDSDNRKFCEVLIDEIDINRKGRFLVWNQSLSAWTRLEADNKKSRQKLRQKVMIALYNCERLLSTLDKENPAAIDRNRTRSAMNTNDREIDYRFVEGGRGTHSPDSCCFIDCSGKAHKRHKQGMSSSPSSSSSLSS